MAGGLTKTQIGRMMRADIRGVYLRQLKQMREDWGPEIDGRTRRDFDGLIARMESFCTKGG